MTVLYPHDPSLINLLYSSGCIDEGMKTIPAVLLSNGIVGYGKTSSYESKTCSFCGNPFFLYHNGMEWSSEGYRGYRCTKCKSVKPEKVIVEGVNHLEPMLES